MIGGVFQLLQQEFDLLNSVSGITIFAIGAIFVSILFFAGDCIVGYFSVPTAPFLEACVKHSGMGYVLTAAVTVMFGGVVLIALIRATIVRLYCNG